MKRIVEAGRLELKGAGARFKQKGTLEAFDRNLASLRHVRVRQTPAPRLAIFADFEFEDAVFRVWQDSTLIPYKDFLEKVEPMGLANFRAMIGYATRALSGNDLATTEFVAGKPPERFATNGELAAYDEAMAAGGASPAAPAPAAKVAPPERAKEKVVAEAWQTFAGEIRKEQAESRRVSPLPGFALVVMGLTFGAISALTMRRAIWIPEGAKGRGATFLFVALGFLFSLALLVTGFVFLRRAAASATRDPA